jgi:hypothetical protein
MEGAPHRLDDDGVTDLELVQIVKGGRIRGAVAGDGHIARLTGQGRTGVVARALSELIGPHAFDDHVVAHADTRYRQVPDGRAEGRIVDGGCIDGCLGSQGVTLWFCAFGRGGLRPARSRPLGVELGFELATEMGLGRVLGQGRTPELIGHERQK